MKLFAPLYEKTLRWAEHERAPWYLGAMSFAESSFFPVPVDIMLAPMAMRQPHRWAWFAAIAALASVLGGVAGYLLGYGFWEWMQPHFVNWGWMAGYTAVAERINEEGVWVLFIASFTPVPYKVATIAAGTLNMALLPFVLVSLVGRAARFFLVAGLVAWVGPKIERKIHHYIEWAGWACIALIVIAYAVHKL